MPYRLHHTAIKHRPPARVKILIVDDHAILREGIRTLLSLYQEFEVVGEAADYGESVRKAVDLAPDMILMGLVMPVLDGMEATRRIRQALPNARVLMLSQYEAREYFLSAIRAGAAGYLSTKVSSSELVTAIRAVSNGGCYLSTTAARALIESCRQKLTVEPFDLLSGRQREIMKLIAEGHTSRSISQMMNISLRTVEGHRLKLMRRLGARNQAGLIEYAVRKGVVPIGS